MHGSSARIRALEQANVPPPPYDLQDCFSYMLDKCYRTIADLRTTVRGG